MLDTLIIYSNYEIRINCHTNKYANKYTIIIDKKMENINKIYLTCVKKYCYYLFLDEKVEKIEEINNFDEIMDIIEREKPAPAIIELTKKTKIYHRSIIHYIYPYVNIKKYTPVMYKLLEIIEEPLDDFRIIIDKKNVVSLSQKNNKEELVKLWSKLYHWFSNCLIKREKNVKKTEIYDREKIKEKLIGYEIWEINFLDTFNIFYYFDISHLYFRSKIIEFHKNNREIHGQCGPYHFRHDFRNIGRNSIINHLICKFDYQTYLEIGANNCYHFTDVIAKYKTGVEPDPDLECTEYKKWEEHINVMPSDEFFENLDADVKFDIIFIDGCLLEDNILNDVENSLKHLNSHGTVVVHDCNPPSRFLQRDNYYERCRDKSIIWNNKKYTDRHWNGKAWRMIVTLRAMRDNLSVEVVDADWGIGIIRFSDEKQKLLDLSERGNEDIYDYNTLIKYRKEMLNLISAEQFLRRYP